MAQLTQLPDDVDLSFVAGDTFRIRVRVIDPNDQQPELLAEYTFCAQIALSGDSVGYVGEFAIAPDTADPTHSVILTLSPEETDKIFVTGDGDTFHGVWDLEVTFPSGDVRTVARGTVLCVDDVSKCP